MLGFANGLQDDPRLGGGERKRAAVLQPLVIYACLRLHVARRLKT